jgi:hypothetical protein
LTAAKYAWAVVASFGDSFAGCGGEAIRTRLAENLVILEQTVRHTYKRSHRIIIEPHSAPRDGDGGSEGDDAIFGLPKRGFAAISQREILVR